jgi:molybdate transport system substrate-binding protein
VATGNAEIGFVALSQVAVPGKPIAGSHWVVPGNLYGEI